MFFPLNHLSTSTFIVKLCLQMKLGLVVDASYYIKIPWILLFSRSRIYTHTIANIVSNFFWFLVTKTFHDIQVCILQYFTSSNFLFIRFCLDFMFHFYYTEFFQLLEYFSSTPMFQKLEKSLVRRYQSPLTMKIKILDFWNKNSRVVLFLF